MQPSSFLDNIAQEPEFLSAVSSNNIEFRINCATLKRLPYWSNQPFLIFDVRALWRSVLKIENGGLDQYGKV